MKITTFTSVLCLSALITACGGGSSGGGSSSSSSSSSSSGGAAPTFNVELSNLTLGLDVNEPLAVNHRIPISFTITGESNDSSLIENIPVSFSFVEKDPADPEAPRKCDSNAIDVEVTGDGQAQLIENEFIWPVSECEILAEEGKEILLEVEFYLGEEILEGTVTGGMPELALRNGGVDIEYNLSTESSVALMPLLEGGESALPILSVDSSFTFNGADPYYSLVEPEEISDELKEIEPEIEEELTFGFDEETLTQLSVLPGTATLTYTLIPASTPGEALPLMIGEEDGGTIASFTFDRIEPGTNDAIAHDLYLEGDSLAALGADGAFAQETDFTVRGCVTTSFAQDGNGDTQGNDCRDVEIVMERESADSGAASEITFNKTLSRSPGTKRIRINAVMKTENSLSQNGAFSSSEGKVELKGKIGKSFSLVIAQALAEAELSPVRAAYDVQLMAFNEVLFSRSDEQEAVLVFEEEFSVEKSRQLGGFGFGFGPVRLGITISAGGRVGLNAEDELALLADEAECQDVLGSENVFSSCARMSRTVTPGFSMTSKIFGGLNLRIVRVGLQANLRLIDTSFPLTNTLGFGLTDDNKFLVSGNVNWDSQLILISGKVKAVGSIKIFRRRRSKSVTIFKFSSKPIVVNLLNRSINTQELL